MPLAPPCGSCSPDPKRNSSCHLITKKPRLLRKHFNVFLNYFRIILYQFLLIFSSFSNPRWFLGDFWSFSMTIFTLFRDPSTSFEQFKKLFASEKLSRAVEGEMNSRNSTQSALQLVVAGSWVGLGTGTRSDLRQTNGLAAPHRSSFHFPDHELCATHCSAPDGSGSSFSHARYNDTCPSIQRCSRVEGSLTYSPIQNWVGFAANWLDLSERKACDLALSVARLAPMVRHVAWAVDQFSILREK